MRYWTDLLCAMLQRRAEALVCPVCYHLCQPASPQFATPAITPSFNPGADAHSLTHYGQNLLHFCRSADLVSRILAAGVDLEQRDTDGMTPLLDAANEDDDLSRMKALLAAGADPNAVDDGGRTALHLVVAHDLSEALDLFLDAGVGVDTDAAGRTPLMHAADRCRADMTKLLLERGADVHARDNAGATALHLVNELQWGDERYYLQSVGEVVKLGGRRSRHRSIG